MKHKFPLPRVSTTTDSNKKQFRAPNISFNRHNYATVLSDAAFFFVKIPPTNNSPLLWFTHDYRKIHCNIINITNDKIHTKGTSQNNFKLQV